MKALIDGDILLYQFGSLTDDEGHPLRWDLICNHLNAKIREIVQAVGAKEYVLFISGKDNFRIKEATIKPYKGNREKTEKPHAYYKVKDFLTSGKAHKFKISEGYEADDDMGIAQCNDYFSTLSRMIEGEVKDYVNTVICSNDKDMRTVPGWHYSWAVGERIKEKPLEWITEDSADMFFYTQLLTGDSVDNIPGLHGIGPVNAAKRLDGLTGAYSLYCRVRSEYEMRFGSYWKLFLHENARLLSILRSEEDDIRITLDDLEEKRIRLLKEQEEF